MPPLRDANTIDKFRAAFQDHNSGGVSWNPVPALEWLRRNFSGITQQAVNCLILDHINSGGEIDQVVETREDYLHCGYHYDFLLRIRNRCVYVETILQESRMGPVVTVVNIHNP